MLIYCQKKNNRVAYIWDYIFGERFGISYSVTSDLEMFKNEAQPKINYSDTDLGSGFWICPSALLFETGVHLGKPEVRKEPYLQLFPQEKGDFPFDIFSACFWLITRYEEYSCKENDSHGRYYASLSLSFQEKFLERPIIDEWLIKFKAKLSEFFPQIQFKQEQFEVLPTIDVDSAWCYKNKGLLRFLGAVGRDVLRRDFKTLKDRLLVVLSLKDDPHYQFMQLKKWYQEFHLRPLFFVLASEYSSFDKNTSVKKKSFKTFVKDIASFGEPAIHFSYFASKDTHKMAKELQTLSRLVGQKITKNRQHFLRFNLPEYYRNIEKQGITDDYSMGYADHIGFRAGTSRPFLFYDLEQERISHLRIHPFCIMDVSLKNYQKKTQLEAWGEIERMMQRLQKVEGKFITLWHNESLSNYGEWKGWQAIYQKMLKVASKR